MTKPFLSRLDNKFSWKLHMIVETVWASSITYPYPFAFTPVLLPQLSFTGWPCLFRDAPIDVISGLSETGLVRSYPGPMCDSDHPGGLSFESETEKEIK